MHTPRTRFRQSVFSVVALVGALHLAACNFDSSDSSATQPEAASADQPPVPVGVIVARTEPAPLISELPGRTTPFMVAELRPQVTGIIRKRLFTEGSLVQAGQTLYQIDPSTYRAAFDSAVANKARAEANLYNARLKAERYAELVDIEAVSKQANDDAAAALKQAEAEVAAARAAVDKARIDLDFTRVKSPISGHIGRSTVTPGALVTANQAAALATVQQLDPIYVDLTQSSVDLQRLRRDVAAGRISLSDGDIPVQLLLEDGSLYGHPGRLAFSEVSVDPGTGSVTLRASFPNPGGELLPGMYVRARLVQGQTDQAILMPHAAVSHDTRGNSLVMVVDEKNRIEARPVQIRGVSGDKWIITGGLAAGERVVVEGLQKIRPGAPVVIATGTPAVGTSEQAAAAPAQAAAVVAN
ncbi:MAG: efflux RND transporter periplasmic adaptor subunit [Azoarcus sp.]|jgi:membrane fusion protein (multidrug efflux system)|nr:efflux RND transporter periplasmic adaptor subunit [Azoarcus sp.]